MNKPTSIHNGCADKNRPSKNVGSYGQKDDLPYQIHDIPKVLTSIVHYLTLPSVQYACGIQQYQVRDQRYMLE